MKHKNKINVYISTGTVIIIGPAGSKANSLPDDNWDFSLFEFLHRYLQRIRLAL
jgi:hypothetical protein